MTTRQQQRKEQEAIIALQSLLSFEEARKEQEIIERRKKNLKNPMLLRKISLQTLCIQLYGISGQCRSTILETWMQENKGYIKKKP